MTNCTQRRYRKEDEEERQNNDQVVDEEGGGGGGGDDEDVDGASCSLFVVPDDTWAVEEFNAARI